MAFIYRYQLKDTDLRKNISLMQYNQEIQAVLEKLFNKKLKDYTIENDFFEFKLYETVHKGLLQEMGRMLKSSLPINISRYGFVRMKQTLYALVYLSPEKVADNTQKDAIHIELIDSTLLDEQNAFMQKANRFFEKASSRGLLIEKGYTVNPEVVIKNYYIDILEAYIDKHAFPKLTNNANEISCYYIRGFHRRVDNRAISIKDQSTNELLPLESCFDIGAIMNRNSDNGIEEAEQSRLDYLEIKTIEERPELVERIKNELSLYIPQVESIEVLGRNLTDGKDKYVFRVHNVGQALATSLSYENNPPFLYFDYGMPHGINSSTRPPVVNMPTIPGTSIILSHVDKDHWFRIADDINAYQCHWFIPDQPRKTRLNQKLAEIIVHGGSVQTIASDLIFPTGRITCGGRSKIEPFRAANHVHETGLTFRLQAKDTNGDKLNILIAGDQRYDYVDQGQIDDLDILVASHHGGRYCVSGCACVPAARNNKTSTIIYSYGDGNSYGHPDTENYIRANWIQEHHTKDGDYKKDIYLYQHTEIVKLDLDGTAHIELAWTEKPLDLDLHLFYCPIESNLIQKVNYASNNIEGVRYGGDIRAGGGQPERICINTWHEGVYDLWVNNFSRIPELSKSDASLSFFIEGPPQAWKFECPKDGSGQWWHILRINVLTGIAEFINRYEDIEVWKYAKGFEIR